MPSSPKRKDLPKLDEVPRKKRKFLEASTVAAAKATLPQLSSSEAQLALIIPEPVMEEIAPQEAPLEVQGTLPESLEAQSQTLMIQGVLGELVPTGEAMDAPGLAAEEEEGSSSTPGKDDADDKDVASVVQIFDSPIRPPVASVAVSSLKLVQGPPQDEVIMPVEESVHEGDAGNAEELGLREEAQVTLAPEAVERVLAFVQTLNDSSPYYERLRKKRAFLSDAAPLSCEGHPFFADVLTLPEMMKSFYNELLAIEGNIFQDCSVA